MNLQQNSRYPITKFLAEELSGRFYESELSCLNRMLILYHNRVSFAIDDSPKGYLDEWRWYLSGKVTYWWMLPAKRDRINWIRRRMLYVLIRDRKIFEQLLAKPDYLSLKAKTDTIKAIYDWLAVDPNLKKTSLDLVGWRQSLGRTYGPFFNVGQSLTSVSRDEPTSFDQLLSASDKDHKLLKFQRLVEILQNQGWVSTSHINGVYQFRDRGKGARLQIGALYYTLNLLGHIEKRLPAPSIAALFSVWLDHGMAAKSFEKIFQAEQQQTFDCVASQPRFRYVKDCQLMLRDL